MQRKGWVPVLSLLLAGCAGGGSAPVSSTSNTNVLSPPDQTGMPAVAQTWTYQQQIIKGDTTTTGKTGTITVTYQGTNTYRGGSYYTTETRSTVTSPPFLTTYYQTGAQFSEFAGVFYNFPIVPGCQNQEPQFEEFVDSPISFATAGSVSQNVTLNRCGFAPSVSSLGTTLTDKGSNTLSTPAGVLATRVLEGDITMFNQREHVLEYVFGKTIVGRDGTTFDSAGNVVWQFSVRYMSGPLDVAFPGIPELFNQEY